MPISRTRRVQHKVHIPSSARENQYLLAKFAITDSLIERISGPVDHSSDCLLYTSPSPRDRG